MDALTAKVRALLRTEFGALTDRFEPRRRGGHLIGIIVSRDFARLNDAARMNRLWKVLEDGLKPAELRRVGPIAALSPAEAATLPNGSELLAPRRSNGRRNGVHSRRRVQT